MVSATKISVIL